jgi:hypothetical protein
MKKILFALPAFFITNFLTISVHAADIWSYRTNEDKMTGKSTKFASLTSDNRLNFQFPYEDPANYGYLTIRQKAGEPAEVLFSIGKGQILCPGYGSGCTVTVRFNNDKPMQFSAIGPSDHSSTTLFILNESRFISGAKKANRILIKFTAYNAGEQILEFKPATYLEWNNNTKSKK